jgi:hypothetical protein
MMGTGGVFRVRRVGEWLGQEPSEDITKSGGLTKGAGKMLTLAQYAPLSLFEHDLNFRNSEFTDLKQMLIGAIPEASTSSHRTISAT